MDLTPPIFFQGRGVHVDRWAAGIAALSPWLGLAALLVVAGTVVALVRMAIRAKGSISVRFLGLSVQFGCHDQQQHGHQPPDGCEAPQLPPAPPEDESPLKSTP